MALTNLLRASWFIPPGVEGFWGRPLFLWGRPGIGKTHIVDAEVRRYNMVSERLSPAERGEGQFGVIGVPGADGFLHYPAPAWAQKFENAAGVIFIDEANLAPPGSIQGALLGLVQLRTLGSFKFNPRTRTCAAANEVADAAGGWDLPHASLNRYGHLSVDSPDATEWGIAFLSDCARPEGSGETIDAATEEKRVIEAWPAIMAKARGLVNGFIMRRPEMLDKPPVKGAKVKSWPTPRTVVYAAEALASAELQGLSESESDELMGAFVGVPWVSEFKTWSATADLPNPADLLDGKVKYAHDTRRLDRTLAVLGACASLVAPKTAANRKARAGAAWTLIGKVLEDAADVAIPAARVLVNAGLVASVVPESKPILSKLDDLLTASGVSRSRGA